MPKRVTIAEIEQQSHEGIARFQRLIDDLDDAQLLWRPAQNSWSIAECVEHLNSSLATYRRVMRSTFERERQTAPLAPASFRIGMVASTFMSMLEPPYRVKVKAPDSLLPAPEIDARRTVEEFLRSRQEFLDLAREASRVDMSSIRFANPMVPLMKFSLAEAFLVMLAHDRRHLWQAENVRKHPEFPAS